MTAIVGRKVGMTQIFDDRGNVIPVPVIEAGPCVVTEVRTPERDGYAAVQVGFDPLPERKVTKPLRGHFAKTKTTPRRVLREFRLPDGERYELGQEITVAAFGGGDVVDVVGTSKGRGFAGTIKRYHFNRQPKTHGASDRTRARGASSSTTTPGRLYKGTRMAGHMGSERVTVQNLEVMVVDNERNLLAVRGSVPGAKGGVLIIKPARPRKGSR